MNRNELIEKYGTPEAAAEAVAAGTEPVVSGDFESWPDAFRDLVTLKAVNPAVPAKKV